MREVNINMEGYNVNGVCLSCLAHGRRMVQEVRLTDYYRLLADIEIPEGVSVQVCWECAAAVRNVQRFQNQIRDSFRVLEAYSKTSPFLNSPSDLTKHCTSRLAQYHIYSNEFTVNSQPSENKSDEPIAIKQEDDDYKFELIEVSLDKEPKLELSDDLKEIFDNDDTSSFADHAQPSSDDEKLSVISQKKNKKDKTRKHKKKRKEKLEKTERTKDSKERRALQLKNYRMLHNLNEAELFDMDDDKMFEVRKRDLADDNFTKLAYKCEDCISGFNTEKLMVDHMNSKHKPKDQNGYHCDVCRVYLLTEMNVNVHRRLHLVGYRCKLCGFETGVKHLMMRHEKQQHRAKVKNTDEWPCSVCDKVFSTKSKLTYHRGAKHQERPQCDCCGKVFANKMTLKYHLKILPYDKSEKEPKEKLYLPCKGCNKVFYSRKSYRAHVVIHDGLEYPCPVCGKLFQWKRNLARHIRNHREKDTGTFYDCRACNKRFSSKDCYNNHMRFSKKHVSEESYSHMCTHCGKKFASKYCLVDHIDWDHLRNIKYECSHCGKAFKTAKIMVAHMNNIHGDKGKQGREPDGQHLCDICGKSYKTQKRLKGHVWAMHTHRSTSKTFKCKLCPATFTWQTSIYKHVKMMHHNPKRKQPVARTLPSQPHKRLRDDRLNALPLDGMYFQSQTLPYVA